MKKIALLFCCIIALIGCKKEEGEGKDVVTTFELVNLEEFIYYSFESIKSETERIDSIIFDTCYHTWSFHNLFSVNGKLEIYEYSLYTVYGSVNIYNDYWKNFIFGGNIIEYNKEYNYYFSNDSLIIMQTQNTYSINSYKVKEKTDDKMILIYDDFELIFIKKPD